MTNIIRRCPKCKEVIYRFKKGNRPSKIVLGAEMWLHLLICDKEAYDKAIEEAWNS